MQRPLQGSLFVLTALGAVLSISPLTAAAQEPLPLEKLFRGGVPHVLHAQAGRAHCGHVINLLMRHCLLKRSGLAMAGPFGHPFLPHHAAGDLKLASVSLVAEASEAAGPLYEVTICNASQRCVRRFSISAVAVLGAIDLLSPISTIEIGEIAPGATITAQLQLPQTAMAMSPDGQSLAPFDTLVVALDSFDELIEADELNNVLVLPRAGIPLVAVAAPPPSQSEGAVPAPADTAPKETPPPAASAPGQTPDVEPESKIDFDSLDLGEPEPAAQR